MTDPNKKKIKQLIHRIGLNNFLVDDEVKKIVESQFRFTYEKITETNFEDLTNEEIDELKKTFIYKYIGKIFTNSTVVNGFKESVKKKQLLKQLKEESENE